MGKENNPLMRDLVLNEQGILNDLDQAREVVKSLTDLIMDMVDAPTFVAIEGPTLYIGARAIHAVSCTSCAEYRKEAGIGVSQEQHDSITRIIRSLVEDEDETPEQEEIVCSTPPSDPNVHNSSPVLN